MADSYTIACYIQTDDMTGCREQLTDTGPRNSTGNPGSNHIPYEILLQDLTQAKRQLLDLHSLVSLNSVTLTWFYASITFMLNKKIRFFNKIVEARITKLTPNFTHSVID